MVLQNLTDILRQGRRYRHILLEPHGMNGWQCGYLTEIAAHPGMSQDQLAQILCLNKSNVARRVAALEDDGFVTRRPSERDKRVMELRLTDKAAAMLPYLYEIQEQWDSYLTQDMTQEEKELLTQLLARMQKRASGWRKEDDHV